VKKAKFEQQLEEAKKTWETLSDLPAAQRIYRRKESRYWMNPKR
jgi:chaperonin cofactor prefoldin